MNINLSRNRIKNFVIRPVFLCFSLFYGITSISGQSLNFDHYSVENGISQSEIKCIYQDSEGYIWIGTQNGLNRFDGYTFEKYFYDPSNNYSISNNWIFGITEDPDGGIWLGTKGGLNKFDKKNDLFYRVDHRNPNSIIEDNFVYGLIADETSVYINTPPILTILNIKTGTLEAFKNEFDYDGAVYDIGIPIMKDSEGLIWLGSHQGLSYFDPVQKQFTNFYHAHSDPNSINNNHITALYEDKLGNIMIGTADGMNLYNKGSKQITGYFQENENSNYLNNNIIHSIIQDYTGAIWIGTEGTGLNKISFKKDGSIGFDQFRSGTGTGNVISHDIVYSLYVDNSSNLWVGTIAGLDKTDLKKKNFMIYKKSDNPNSIDLLDNVIASVYKDISGKLWIGNWGKGLNILNRSTNEVVHYSSDFSGKMHIPENHVHVIFEDSESIIWLGTRDGVCIYNENTGRFIPVQDYFTTEKFNLFDNNRVYCMIEDSTGKIWIGTGNGINILDKKTKRASSLKAGSEGPLNISSNLVYSLLEDKDRNVWIATSNGLDRYIPGENTIYHYLNNPASTNTLIDNFTISLCEDYLGNIWIGTSSGVNIFHKPDSVFSYYSTNDGLPNNIIYDIIEDNNSNLWLSTGGGLAMINPGQEISNNFMVIDELRGKEFNLNAVFKSTDGEMFFGGIDGMVSFYPDSIRENNYIPPIRITSFEKESEGIRKRLNVYTDKIELSHKEYSFTIEFSALDYTNPSKNRYAYQMAGISDQWIDIGNRRFIHFTNLPPREYTFNVKGTNNDGVWNDIPTSIKIKIHPPWWRSTYAYISYLISGFVLIVLIIKRRERKLIIEKRKLETKVDERTAEIALQKEKVEESEEKLRSTISSIDDLVFVLDQHGIFKEFYYPGKLETIFKNQEYYINKHFENVGFPEEIIQQLKNAFENLKQADTIQEFDYFDESEGKGYWYNAKISPRRNTRGELTGLTIVARDITGRKIDEEQLREQKEKLNDLNVTKDTFFSILAHDLKNPFSNLYSMSELISENYNNLDEEEKVMMLKNMNKTAELIYNLLENLLTWSNSQRGRIEYNPTIFNLANLIQVNINLHKVQAENKGVILKPGLKDDIHAYGDSEMINTVLRNLINNAVKFTDKGGSVEVSVKKQDEYIEVQVKDEGVGISPENLQKLFQIDVKFKSKGTKEETGTGLGLIICKEFIEKNGGNIRAESEEGSGSAFYFTVPVKQIK
jgi:PAS domain S-box-containing protein